MKTERQSTVLTLSFKSSTMLFKGPLVLESNGALGFPPGVAKPGVGAREWSADSSVGDGGADSPRTVVLGRKREAMMTRWCLSELIAEVGEQRQLMDDESKRWNPENLAVCAFEQNVLDYLPHR